MIVQIDPEWVTKDDSQLSPTGEGLCRASAVVEVEFFGERLTVTQLCTRDSHLGNPLHVSGLASSILAAWVDDDEYPLPSMLEPLDFKTAGELEALDVIADGMTGSVCFSLTPPGADPNMGGYMCCRTDTTHKTHIAYGGESKKPVYAVWLTA